MALTPEIFEQMTELVTSGMSAGHYSVRLAETLEEVEAAQRLRYQVLFEESGGKIDAQMFESGREEDQWDEVAYHVIVFDTKDGNNIVGTVRLVSRSALKQGQQFYTEHAFDLDKLRANFPTMLELSRACVSAHGRGGAILMLMWKFTMQFIEKNSYDLLFGCASFAGTDYHQHTGILSYLYEENLAADSLMPAPKESVDSVDIASFCAASGQGNKRGNVPTLLRGYLKIGAKISDHAIIDPIFNTTFVAIYVDAKEMFSLEHALVYKAT